MKRIIHKPFLSIKAQVEPSKRIVVLENEVIQPANNNSGKARHLTFLQTLTEIITNRSEFHYSK